MSNRHAAPDRDTLAMHSAGALAYVNAELDTLEAQIQAAPTWKRGRALLAEVEWAREKIAQLDETWGQKLVIAIVGPSGAGKSTLLNALAGRQLSSVGFARPTTRQVVVYAATMADAEPLIEHVGADQVQVQLAPDADGLEYLTLIDTPDTNTIAENQRLLAKLLERADILLAVFPAHNPKMHDNITFLAPYVRQLPPEAIIPALNMVDRAPRAELEREIVPDFQRVIRQEWQINPEKVYLLSAKTSAPGETFLPDETPLHEVNEFPALRRFLFEALNQAGQVADRRMAQAEHLLDVLRQDTCRTLEQSAPQRQRVAEDLADLHAQAQRTLAQEMGAQAGRGSGLDLHAALYGMFAQRWWGPVGWLIALWSVILRIGGFFSHLGRPANPLTAIWGAETEKRPATLPAPQIRPWFHAIERLYAEQWPPIADALVQAGFDPRVRETAFWEQQTRASEEQVQGRWAAIYEEHLARLAGVLAAWPLQLLFNLPVIGIALWIGAETILGFFTGNYLPADYFRSAAIVTAIVWALAFIAVQVVVSVALRRTLRRRITQALAEATAGLMVGPLQGELDALASLERSCHGN